MVILLDASAFILGYNLTPDEEYYTVCEVFSEIRSDVAKIRFEGAKSSGRLIETTPNQAAIDELESVALQMGESHRLSRTDKRLLALALQLQKEGRKPVIVSEDYSVQNMASRLGIGFKPLSVRGISRRLDWIIYCPGCGKVYEKQQEDGICPICGTRLKTKPSRKKVI